MIGLTISAFILYFYHQNITILWIFCTVLGFFTGPIFPSCFGWANRYIEVTSPAQMVAQIGGSIGDVAFLAGIGFSYQNYGPFVIWSYLLFLAVGLIVLSWIMQILGSLHGDRFSHIDDTFEWHHRISWCVLRLWHHRTSWCVLGLCMTLISLNSSVDLHIVYIPITKTSKIPNDYTLIIASKDFLVVLF